MSKEELLEKLGKKIIELRKKQALSQTDLAYLCDWDRQVLHKIEKGKINCSIYVIYRIAKELKVPLKEILDIE